MEDVACSLGRRAAASVVDSTLRDRERRDRSLGVGAERSSSLSEATVDSRGCLVLRAEVGSARLPSSAVTEAPRSRWDRLKGVEVIWAPSSEVTEEAREVRPSVEVVSRRPRLLRVVLRGVAAL